MRKLGPFNFFSSRTKFWNSPQRQVPRPTGHDPTTNPQMTLNQRVRQRVARRHCQGGCRCADIAVLLLSRIREDFQRAAMPLSKMLHLQIEGDCWRADIAVLPQSLRRSLRSLAIAVLKLSRIRGDRQRATIVIIKVVAPQNPRGLLTRQHCSLATIVDEVSAQSCHRSLTVVKDSRRTKDVGRVGNNQSNRQIFRTNRRGSQTRN
jgi:hypothetical protein